MEFWSIIYTIISKKSNSIFNIIYLLLYNDNLIVQKNYILSEKFIQNFWNQLNINYILIDQLKMMHQEFFHITFSFSIIMFNNELTFLQRWWSSSFSL